MEYLVEGQEVSPEKLSDESRHNAEQPCALSPLLSQLSPPPRLLPSRHHRRHRIGQVPRLHIPTATLHFLVSQPTRFTSSAAQKAPSVPARPPARISRHGADSPCQQHLYSKRRGLDSRPSLTAHHLPHDDALKGILYHAFDDFTDQAILDDLQASNPTLTVVGGRRMGKSPHILVTLMDTKLTLRLRLLPFRNKVEACFNCRSTGHWTNVCPKPRQERCHRCGALTPHHPKDRHPFALPAASSATGITPRTAPTANTATCSALNVQRPWYLTLAPRHLVRAPGGRALSPASCMWFLTTPTPQRCLNPPLIPRIRHSPAAPPARPRSRKSLHCSKKTPPSDSSSLPKALKLRLRRPRLIPSRRNCKLFEEKLETAITQPSFLPSPIDSSSDMDIQTPERCTIASAADPTPPFNLFTFLKRKVTPTFPSRVSSPTTTQHHPLPHSVTVVLTRRTLVVNRADLPFPEVHHVFLEVLPQHREQPSLFLLNVYNPPRATENALLLALLRAARPSSGAARMDDPPPADLIRSPPSEEQWEALFSSNGRDIQTRVLGRAEDVIEKHTLAAYVA
ncbi:hypothetical protein HPB52_007702 [Rhipicephalus sanguineus]|uniref:CCHC-type domain-containing protein n=1 Tax=Rhipicephalus sanguineus TaxID=34632 RepID=A0A9D4QII5_RHISA|nr:hypothetical protein HPB52_007702 [Rhipicephalus sanguineus]